MNTKRCYGCMRPHEGPGVCPHCGYDSSQPHATHQLPAGTLLRDQYLIGKVLGQGGFGITYLGWDLYLDIPVAIKEYFPGGTVSRDTGVTLAVTSYTGQVGQRFRDNKERFMREAKSLARFSEVPEIVQVKNFFQDNNTAYIVMEYVKGVTLKQYVKNQGGRLPADQTIAILRPVLEALAKVHSAGLVHRDISPDNIMLLPDGHMKLLDFGAVRDVGTDVAVDQESNRSTEAILKQGYAPIEQYQSRGSLGPWTDVYALCATIYYCITGQVPPDAPERLLGEERLPLDELAPELTAQQRNALVKGMELRAENRYASVNELYQDLYGDAPAAEPVMEIEPPPHKTTIAVKKTRGSTKSQKPLVIGLAAVLVAAIAAVGVIALSNGPLKTDKNKPATSTDLPTNQKQITGQCGEDVTYALNAKTGEMTISGKGKMWDFKGEDVESDHACPWEEQMDDLRSVTVEEGVTHIGANAFLLSPVETVTLSDTVESVGQYAFAHCLVLEEVSFGKALKTIENSAFFNCELKQVELPDGVTTIGQFAFADYSSAEDEQPDSLTAVKLGKSLESIGQYAFYGTAIQELTLPDTLLTVGEAAFANCTALGKIQFGTGLKEIGDDAFYQCAIQSAVLPNSLQTIGDTAFALCIQLGEITFGSSVTTIGENCFFGAGIQNLELPHKLTTLGGGAFAYCEKLEAVILPDGLKKLELSTFYNCPAMKSIAIGKNTTLAKETVDGVTVTPFNHQDAPDLPKELVIQCEAGSDANTFADEFKLNTQILVTGQCGDNVTFKLDTGTGQLIISGTGNMWNFNAGEYIADCDCPWADYRDTIRSVSIGSGVENVGDCAFWTCKNLKTVSLGSSVQKIGHAAFYQSALEALILPDSVETIAAHAFRECASLKSASLGAVKEIGYCGFYKSAMETVVIPDSVTTMGQCAFYGCGALRQVTLSDSLTKIDEFTFGATAIDSIVIPASVMEIVDYAFSSCTALTKVTYESKNTKVGEKAFDGCTKLQTSEPQETKPQETKPQESKPQESKPQETKPQETKPQESKPQETQPQRNVVTGQCGDQLTYSLNLDTGAMTISGTGKMWNFNANKYQGDCDCVWADYLDKIRSVTIGNGVTSIGGNAFSGCGSLEKVTFGNSVKVIERSAFYETALKTVTIPNNVETVSDWAFCDCASLNTVSLGSVKEIGYLAFGGTAITKIVIPDSVHTLGKAAFSSCKKLKSITIGASVTSIAPTTFDFSFELEEIYIPANVKEIGAYAFNSCTALKKVTIASSETEVDPNAFSSCTKLQDIVYLDS